jgi:hypothetical protein
VKKNVKMGKRGFIFYKLSTGTFFFFNFQFSLFSFYLVFHFFYIKKFYLLPASRESTSALSSGTIPPFSFSTLRGARLRKPTAEFCWEVEVAGDGEGAEEALAAAVAAVAAVAASSAAAAAAAASLSALCAGDTEASAAAVAALVAALAAASTADANPYHAPNCSFRIASAASCRALTAAGLAAAAAFRAASAFCSSFLRKRAAAAKGSSMAPPWPDIIAATPGRSGVVFLRGVEGREKEREERSEFLFLFFLFFRPTEKKNPKKSKKLPKPLTRQDLLRHVLQRGKVLLLDPMDA